MFLFFPKIKVLHTGTLLRVEGGSSGENSIDNLFLCREVKGRHTIFSHKYHIRNLCGSRCY
jgi:hypothetical protein